MRAGWPDLTPPRHVPWVEYKVGRVVLSERQQYLLCIDDPCEPDTVEVLFIRVVKTPDFKCWW